MLISWSTSFRYDCRLDIFLRPKLSEGADIGVRRRVKAQGAQQARMNVANQRQVSAQWSRTGSYQSIEVLAVPSARKSAE
jgi:hypothetical protein